MRAGIVGGHWWGALVGLAALAAVDTSRAAEVRLAAGEAAAASVHAVAPPHPGGTPVSAPPVDDPDRVDAPSPPASERSRGVSFGASAALVADAGSLPGAGIGAALGVAIGVDPIEVRVLGTYLPPRGASIGAVESRSPGAEIELLAGSLLACAPRLLRAPPLAIGACAGAEYGRLEGTGTGIAEQRTGGYWWSALRADAVSRWALGGGFGLGLQLSALVPLDRDEFAVQNVGRVFRPWRVTSRATLALIYEIGSAP